LEPFIGNLILSDKSLRLLIVSTSIVCMFCPSVLILVGLSISLNSKLNNEQIETVGNPTRIRTEGQNKHTMDVLAINKTNSKTPVFFFFYFQKLKCEKNWKDLTGFEPALRELQNSAVHTELRGNLLQNINIHGLTS
jgi:hypothetical protein